MKETIKKQINNIFSAIELQLLGANYWIRQLCLIFELN